MPEAGMEPGCCWAYGASVCCGMPEAGAPPALGCACLGLGQRWAPMGSSHCEEGWSSVAGTACASAPLPCTCLPAHCTCTQLLLHVCCMSSVSLLGVWK